ncbi:hypothetical protein [Caulobacter sp. BE254]|uniref:hypothetical protein n=1 Tax=Caulobacter sp. BE254 TaxID=2817720 RepID=UPI00285B8B87|nr:hypothetical protein [Caulobacter sp. BE254]MDR7116970.1 hypothetical protein [Caulobacter sp. BE254]
MTPSRLARAIMHLAVRRPPRGREDWALAMTREFEAAEHNHLSWALGCLGATATWRLRTDAIYLITLLIVPVLLENLGVMISFSWHRSIPRDTLVTVLTAEALVWPFLASVVLSAYRPHNLILTVAAVALIPLFAMDVIASFMFGEPITVFWWLNPKATLYMAPPLVGLAALLGVCHFGAMLGASIGRRRTHTV